MPTPVLLLLIATLLPVLSLALLAGLGRQLGSALSGWLAIVLAGGSFGCCVGAMFAWINNGQLAGTTWGPGDKPIELIYRWLPVTTGLRDVVLYVDSLTIGMSLTITIVLLLINVFAVRFLAKETHLVRFFAWAAFLEFCVLGLVISGTLLQMLAFMELTAIAGSLLTATRYDNRQAVAAAMKMLAVLFIGSAIFIAGLGLLFQNSGSTMLSYLSRWLYPDGLVSTITMTRVGITLLLGTMGLAAQFPLHTWLADSSEGPAPASAMILSVGTVAGGVYAAARLFPALTWDARLFLAIIGLVTLTFAALFATLQNDLKRAVSLCILSQIGCMMMALGIGCWVGGMFHLITQAFSAATLMLACGSAIRAAGGQRHLACLGGLIRQTPLTAICFGLAALSAAAMPGFSGSYSRAVILDHAAAFAGDHGKWFKLFYTLPLAATGITAFALMRCWMLTFWGKPRGAPTAEQFREPAGIFVPLAALAVLCVISASGIMRVREIISQSVTETSNISGQPEIEPAGAIENAQTPNEAAGLACGGGMALACVLYLRGTAITGRLMRIAPLRLTQRLVNRRIFLSEILYDLPVGIVMWLGRLAALLDRLLLSGRAES